MSNSIPPYTCHCCGYTMDRTTCMNMEDRDNKPEPGDITVCVECGDIGLFTDTEGNIRPATQAELREFQRDSPDIWKQVERFSRMVRMDGLRGRAL